MVTGILWRHPRLSCALYKPGTRHVSAVPPISAIYQSPVTHASATATSASRQHNDKKPKGRMRRYAVHRKGNFSPSSNRPQVASSQTNAFPAYTQDYGISGSPSTVSSAVHAGIQLDKESLMRLSNREAYRVLEDLTANRIRTKLDGDTYEAMCEICCRLAQSDSKGGFTISWSESREKILSILHIADSNFDRQTGTIIPVLAAASRLCAERGDLLAVVRIFNRAGPQGIYFCNVLFHGIAKAIRRSKATLVGQDVEELRRLCKMLQKGDVAERNSNGWPIRLSFPAAKDLLGALAQKTSTDPSLLAGLWMDSIALLEPKYATTRTLNEVLNYLKTYCIESRRKGALLSHNGPASSVYRTLVAQGVEPDEVTFNTMMSIASKEQSITSALTSLAAAKEKGFGVSSRMITSLMTLFLQEDDYIPLFRLYQIAVSCGAWDDGLNFRFIAGPLRRNRIDVSLSALRVASICSYLNTYGELPPTVDQEHIQLKREELIQEVEKKEKQKRYAEYLRDLGSKSKENDYIDEMMARADAELAKAHRQMKEYIPSVVKCVKSAKDVSDKYTDDIIALVEEVAQDDSQTGEADTAEYPVRDGTTALSSSDATFLNELDSMLQHALCAPVTFAGDTACCNALLDAFGRFSVPQNQFNKLLQWMEKASIQKDRSTFKYVIRYFIRRGQESIAVDYLQRAHQDGHCDNELASTTLNILFRLGKTVSCLDVLGRAIPLDTEVRRRYSGWLLAKILRTIISGETHEEMPFEMLDRTCNIIASDAEKEFAQSGIIAVNKELGESFTRCLLHSVLRRDGCLSCEIYERLQAIYSRLGIKNKLQYFRPYVTDAIVADVHKICNCHVIDTRSVEHLERLLQFFAEFSPGQDAQSIEKQVYISQSVDVLQRLLDTGRKCSELFSSSISASTTEILNNSLKLAVIHDFHGVQPKQRLRSLINFSAGAVPSTAPYTIADVVSPQFSELVDVTGKWLTAQQGQQHEGDYSDTLSEIRKSLGIICTFKGEECQTEVHSTVDISQMAHKTQNEASLAESDWCYHVAIARALRGGHIWEAGRLAGKRSPREVHSSVDVLGRLVRLHVDGNTSEMNGVTLGGLAYDGSRNAVSTANMCLEIAAYNRAYDLYWNILERMGQCGRTSVSENALHGLMVSASEGNIPLRAAMKACRLSLDSKKVLTPEFSWNFSNLLMACFRQLYEYGIPEISVSESLRGEDTVLNDVDRMLGMPLSVSGNGIRNASPVSKDPAEVYRSLSVADRLDLSENLLWKMAILLYHVNSCDSSVWDRLLRSACNLAHPQRVSEALDTLMKEGYHPSEHLLKQMEILFVRNGLYDEAYFVDAQRTGRMADERNQQKDQVLTDN
eukprot:gb/GECG01006490.1/.p1 GENE.gb/GECG01006490.1/~~gb/GECG01006490.1/.p1  ORF type:complete len:1359 (+),score=158.55 gb/GECG01006490.1/:1-4077(+)